VASFAGRGSAADAGGSAEAPAFVAFDL